MNTQRPSARAISPEQERKEKQRAYDREYKRKLRATPEGREANRVRVLEWHRRGRAEDLDFAAKRNARAFGLTLEQYKALHAKYEGTCHICPRPLLPGKGKTAVDHCHKTGRVRGLLCGHCTMGLGHFEDDTQRMQDAIQYLLDSRESLE